MRINLGNIESLLLSLNDENLALPNDIPEIAQVLAYPNRRANLPHSEEKKGTT